MNRLIHLLLILAALVFTVSINAQDNTLDNEKQQVQMQKKQMEQTRKQLKLAEREQKMHMIAQKEALAGARVRLEETARELAELSGRMAGENVFRFMDVNQRRAMLGINIGGVRGDGDSNGVEINGVSPGGPADEAGLKAGDIILSISDESLTGNSSSDSRDKLLKIMEEIDPGNSVTIEYIRDGNTAKAEIETVAMNPSMFNFIFRGYIGDKDFSIRQDHHIAVPFQEFNLRRFFSGPLSHHWGDLELVDLTPKLGKYFGTEEGVLVISAPEDETLKLEDGDVILSIDSRKPIDPNHALRILRSYAPGESLTIEVMRQKRRRKLDVSVPENNYDETAIELIRPMTIRPRTALLPPRPPKPIILNHQRALEI